MLMNLMNEDLARAQMAERLGEARESRRQRELTTAQRMARRTEKAAQRARQALARSL